MDSLFDILLGKSLSGGSGGGGGGGTDNYNALQNKPQINGTTLTGNKSLSDLGIAAASDIPTVNNGTLTIQKNGTTVNTFKANQSSDVTVNITVPTTASDVSAFHYADRAVRSDLLLRKQHKHPLSEIHPDGCNGRHPVHHNL